MSYPPATTNYDGTRVVRKDKFLIQFLSSDIGDDNFQPPDPGEGEGDLGILPDGSPGGYNNMSCVVRLIAVANNRFWYEDIGSILAIPDV